MDKDLILEELHTWNEIEIENDNYSEIENDSDSESDIVICCSPQKTEIIIPELNLKFENNINLLNYLDDKIFFENNYYKIKLDLKSHFIEPCFRDKISLINYFYNRFIRKKSS